MWGTEAFNIKLYFIKVFHYYLEVLLCDVEFCACSRASWEPSSASISRVFRTYLALSCSSVWCGLLESPDGFSHSSLSSCVAAAYVVITPPSFHRFMAHHTLVTYRGHFHVLCASHQSVRHQFCHLKILSLPYFVSLISWPYLI